ncbi:MAG: amino acid ABC transporter substrate-binding protein [Burkholderiaceae bacterium]|nr:MAG: amino acid ABC transporter substrate-binding protein [Burkholderiaceae bacterium]
MENAMKKWTKWVAAGLLPMFLALGSAAAATNDLAVIQKAGVIKIGTEGTFAPFTYHETGGKLVGFDVDMGRAIAKQLGVKAEFVEGPWDGLIAGLNAHRYDLVMNQVGITPEREAKYDFSRPYLSSSAALMVRDDNTTIHSFKDLAGKTAAETLTSNFSHFAQQNGAKIVAVQGFNEAIALVVQGRADATVNDYLSYLDFHKRQPQAKVKVVAEDSTGAFGRTGVLMRKDQPQLQAAINKAIDTILADGTYKQISEHYFGVDLSSRLK